MNSYTEQGEVAVYKMKRVADDTDVGLVIRYIGALASCLIVVDDTTGDISSTVGALGSESTDTNFLEPGGTGGNIDVSDANANTFGKVVDIINSLDDYEAYLVDVLRADATTVGSLLAMAATQAKVSAGIPLYKDTSVVLNLSIAVQGEDLQYSDNGCKNICDYIASKNTYASGASTIQIYEGETLVASWACAATTVEQEKTTLAFGCKGKKLLIRMLGQTYCTGYLVINGKSTRLVPFHKELKEK